MSKDLKLTERGGIWYLVRRIPKRYESVETRTRIVSISLETDSLSAARRKADDVWQAQLDHWQGKLEGRSADDRSAYDAIRKLAQRRGFSYLPVSQVAKLPDEELLARLGAVPETGGRVDPDELAALMGTVESPSLMMSEVWGEFYRLTANRRLHKSRDQVRKWESPFKRALNRWLDVNGDGAVDGLNHDDFISFRSFWIEKIDLEDRSNNTANKDFDRFRTHNQNMTVAARAIADRNTFGHLS